MISLTDSTGRLRARWAIAGGETSSWSDLAGFLFDDTITVSASGPVATATGEMRFEPPSSGGG